MQGNVGGQRGNTGSSHSLPFLAVVLLYVRQSVSVRSPAEAASPIRRCVDAWKTAAADDVEVPLQGSQKQSTPN